MKLNNKKKEQNKVSNNVSTQGGSYSLLVTALVLGILIVINILASVLPANLTKIDISASKLYSITSNTKAVVNSLDKDVTIYWIVQADEEDQILGNFLDKYDSLSSRVKVVKKNPDVYPSFASQYTDQEIANNSLVVECGNKYRYIDASEVYAAEPDYEKQVYLHSFDAEGVVTSAVKYVVSDELPKIYLMSGHGEQDIPEGFAKQIERENIEIKEFSLLKTGGIPEDADCVIMYGPSGDVSAEEAQILRDYINNGGKLMIMASPKEQGSYANLETMLKDHGVELVDGVVIDDDPDYYTFSEKYILMPKLKNTTLTKPLIDANYYVIMPAVQGMQVEMGDMFYSVTKLMETSNESYAKANPGKITVYRKDPGDVEGPFAAAVQIDTDNFGQLIWIGCYTFVQDDFNEYSAGGNMNFAMNCISQLIGETDSVSIRTKSLDYNYLTISDTAAATLKAVMIVVLPLIFVVLGIAVIIIRRRKRK